MNPRPPRLRRLTTAERALALEVFGPDLDAGRVRILVHGLRWPNRAFVAGPSLIVWPRPSWRADFAHPDTPLRLTGTFVHELTHVWQAQRGINLALAKLKAGDRPESYRYGADFCERFEGLNIEQQAMAVEHAFLARRGGRTPFAPGAYAALRLPPRRARGASRGRA